MLSSLRGKHVRRLWIQFPLIKKLFFIEPLIPFSIPSETTRDARTETTIEVSSGVQAEDILAQINIPDMSGSTAEPQMMHADLKEESLDDVANNLIEKQIVEAVSLEESLHENEVKAINKVLEEVEAAKAEKIGEVQKELKVRKFIQLAFCLHFYEASNKSVNSHVILRGVRCTKNREQKKFLQ